MDNLLLAKYVAQALNEIFYQKNDVVCPESIVIENPPNPNLGDYATPLFGFAKELKASPLQKI